MPEKCGYDVKSDHPCGNPVTSKVVWICSTMSIENKFTLENYTRAFCDEHEALIKKCDDCPVLHAANQDLIIKHEGECTISIFTSRNVKGGIIPEKNLCHKCAKLQAIFNNTILLTELVNRTKETRRRSRNPQRSREVRVND